MPYIEQFADDEGGPDAKRELESARQRAGRVWNIVRVMTQNPAVLRASMAMYRAVMFAPSPLSRQQREMLAVVTSRENGCVY